MQELRTVFQISVKKDFDDLLYQERLEKRYCENSAHSTEPSEHEVVESSSEPAWALGAARAA